MSSSDFPNWHGTTIIGVKKEGKVVIAGDGQVSLGQTVIKGSAKKVRKIGYKNVKALTPGQNFKYGDLLIEATAGAPVPNIENGYILNHPDGSLYFEPHGFFDRGIRKIKLDSVITPVINLGLPLFGNFINGKTILLELINFFEPKIVLASTTGGDATFS